MESAQEFFRLNACAVIFFLSCGPVLSDKQFIYLFLQFMVCTYVKTKHVIIGN